MSRIEEYFTEIHDAMELMDSFSEEQWEILLRRVQCNVEGDDAASDVEVALEKAIKQDAKIFPVKTRDHTTWYFVAKDGAGVLAQLREIANV